MKDSLKFASNILIFLNTFYYKKIPIPQLIKKGTLEKPF